jgi:hypothetical protein
LTALACGFAIWGGASAAQNLAVPSGQPLSFLEFISKNERNIVRFRFLAPEIGSSFGYADVVNDFRAVCDAQVMPVLDANALAPAPIVLSMSAADIPFGEVNPDVLQFFEVFRPENGLCIWEEF